jgi:ribosomal protein S18 acetylase RimI-like enzyme
MANEITIRQATPADFKTIDTIARQTWPVAYGSFISADQLAYMLDLFYSESALLQDVEAKNYHYYLASYQGVVAGFMGIEPNFLPQTTKVHKLYILPLYQRLNIGKQLLDFVSQLTLENGGNSLTLNVNRYNSAKLFYEKHGFTVLKSEDILLDFGYLMEDYVLTKSLA